MSLPNVSVVFEKLKPTSFSTCVFMTQAHRLRLHRQPQLFFSFIHSFSLIGWDYGPGKAQAGDEESDRTYEGDLSLPRGYSGRRL